MYYLQTIDGNYIDTYYGVNSSTIVKHIGNARSVDDLARAKELKVAYETITGKTINVVTLTPTKVE